MTKVAGVRFKKILEEIRCKYNLSGLRAIFKEEGLGSAPGWDHLADRLDGADALLQDKAEKVLTALINELVIAGTKDVQIYELQKWQVAQILNEISLVEPASPTFADAYPFSLSETALRGLTNEYELVAKVAQRNGDVSLIFCAKRTFEERIHYEANQVTAAVREAFSGYNKFIAIKQIDFQVFDILTVRSKLDRIEVLIDYPDRIQKPETTDKRCLALLGCAVGTVPSLQTTYEENVPINLFACINNLYKAKNEGRVSRLFLRSPTDSIKKESMTAAKDLRTEKFHAAGVVAVGTITPFDVTITWDSLLNVKGKVEAQVGMPLSSLAAAEPYVRTARIAGATSDSAVVAVVNKLVSYST